LLSITRKLYLRFSIDCGDFSNSIEQAATPHGKKTVDEILSEVKEIYPDLEQFTSVVQSVLSGKVPLESIEAQAFLLSKGDTKDSKDERRNKIEEKKRKEEGSESAVDIDKSDIYKVPYIGIASKLAVGCLSGYAIRQSIFFIFPTPKPLFNYAQMLIAFPALHVALNSSVKPALAICLASAASSIILICNSEKVDYKAILSNLAAAATSTFIKYITTENMNKSSVTGAGVL
jgi:hypothetical protein